MIDLHFENFSRFNCIKNCLILLFFEKKNENTGVSFSDMNSDK